jgi:hypothetical protein
MNDYRAAMAAPEAPPEGARRAGDLVLVTNGAMCARRHPWAIAGMWAWQSCLALIASWPAASLVRAAYGGDPRGDAALWDAGGHALLDLLWHEGHGVAMIGRTAVLSLAFAVVAGLVPLAAMMVAMAYAGRDRRHAGLSRSVAAALRAFGAFAVLLLVFGVAEALVAGAGAGAAKLAERATHASLGEAGAQLVAGALGALFLAGVSVVGVVHDLARAAVVRFQVSGLRGALLGGRAFRAAPVSMWWSWAWRTAAAAAPVAAVAAAATGIGGRGGISLVLLAALHQVVVLSRVALRASWLGRALRSVDFALNSPT